MSGLPPSTPRSGCIAFKNLTGRDMEMVSSRVTCWNYPQGNRLITQGHKGSTFYILNSGEVSIQIKQGMFGKKKKSPAKAWSALWGISLILDQKCTADVVASDNVEHFLHEELFNPLLRTMSHLKTIEEIAIERRAETAKKIDDRGADRTKYGLLFGLPPPVYF